MFCLRLPERKSKKYSLQQKFKQYGTILNRNEDASIRRRSIWTSETINAVQNILRNELSPLPNSTATIVNKFWLWWKTAISRVVWRLQYPEWFLNQCWDPRFLLNLVIGDEADFAMTGAVSTWNIREYAPQGNPSSFNYDWNISRHKVSVWCGLCGNGKNIGPYFW